MYSTNIPDIMLETGKYLVYRREAQPLISWHCSAGPRKLYPRLSRLLTANLDSFQIHSHLPNTVSDVALGWIRHTQSLESSDNLKCARKLGYVTASFFTTLTGKMSKWQQKKCIEMSGKKFFYILDRNGIHNFSLHGNFLM